jgi:hypothetical protein
MPGQRPLDTLLGNCSSKAPNNTHQLDIRNAIPGNTHPVGQEQVISDPNGSRHIGASSQGTMISWAELEMGMNSVGLGSGLK